MKKGKLKNKLTKALRIACELGFYVILFFIVVSLAKPWQDVENP